MIETFGLKGNPIAFATVNIQFGWLHKLVLSTEEPQKEAEESEKKPKERKEAEGKGRASEYSYPGLPRVPSIRVPREF